MLSQTSAKLLYTECELVRHPKIEMKKRYGENYGQFSHRYSEVSRTVDLILTDTY